MRKLLLISALIAFLFSGCKSPDDGTPESSDIAVYIVDYTTNTFESGATLSVAKVSFSFDAIPVTADVEEPNGNLNGSVDLAFSPTGNQVFNAELSEEGMARIFAPALLDPSSFFMLEDPVAYPNSLDIEDIEGPYNESFQTTWEAIDDISLTQIFLEDGGLFGRFLYKPSDAVTEEWKWVIIIYRP